MSWETVREAPTASNLFGSPDISQEINYTKGPTEREGSPLHAFWVSPSTIRHTTLKKSLPVQLAAMETVLGNYSPLAMGMLWLQQLKEKLNSTRFHLN